MDPHTLSNVDKITSKHVKLELAVDFDQQFLCGSATLSCVVTASTSMLKLDTRDLDIKQVFVNEVDSLFTLNENSEAFGARLDIELPEQLQAVGSELEVRVHYKTSPNSSCIQWLTKEQTADKEHPYMFTQAQAIHARSMVPCMDCPGAKVTYSAFIEAPAWSECLMSALLVKKQDKGEVCWFEYKQDVPVPSYLIAMVVGKMDSRDIGPRTRVWSEPSIVESAAFEFQHTEKYIQFAEKIMDQEYVWGRYDLVCLPPSFPYGGMENPCLTFVTPTLIAGDCSLADVVCHEVAHSWTGNLITNKTWEHFWLNEGWTVWLQRKIMAKIHCKEYFDFDATIGWKHMEDSINNYGIDHEFTKLVPTLNGVDPDDSFSSIPYEKGFNFLYYLERTVGSEQFLSFAQHYVKTFKYKTLTTTDFCDLFKSFFDAKNIDYSNVEWENWMKLPGMPIVTPTFDQTLSSECFKAAEYWLSKNQENENAPTKPDWTSSQYIVMLDKIMSNTTGLDKSVLDEMNNIYQFGSSKNAEITFSWQMLCLMSIESCQGEYIFPQVEAFLKQQGRMKYIRPLFRKLFSIQPKGRQLALRVFQEWKLNYHPIAQKMIGRDLEVN